MIYGRVSSERVLWSAVLVQAWQDLVSPAALIRDGALAFFQSERLGRITAFAGIDADLIPDIRKRAAHLYSQPHTHTTRKLKRSIIDDDSRGESLDDLLDE